MRTTANRTRTPRRVTAVGGVVIWAAACVGGLVGLARYRATAGDPAAVPDRWPAAAGLPLAAGADTLVVVVHPRCPCSRATVDDLAGLLARCPPGRLRTTVLFVRPAGVPAGWERTALYEAAAAVPGVAVVVDDGGRAAAAFGATTSGQAALYDPAGRLLFAGGLTPGPRPRRRLRRHVGRHRGRVRVGRRSGG